MDYELLKIIVPSVTSIIVGFGVGYWINRSNETLKSDLQLKLFQSQIDKEEKTLLLGKLEELHQKLNDISKQSAEAMMMISELDHKPNPKEINDITRHATGELNRIGSLERLYLRDDSGSFTAFYSDLLAFQRNVVSYLENPYEVPVTIYKESYQNLIFTVQACTNLVELKVDSCFNLTKNLALKSSEN